MGCWAGEKDTKNYVAEIDQIWQIDLVFQWSPFAGLQLVCNVNYCLEKGNDLKSNSRE